MYLFPGIIYVLVISSLLSVSCISLSAFFLFIFTLLWRDAEEVVHLAGYNPPFFSFTKYSGKP